jgi:Zn-dependent protease with chaperone function
VALVEEAEPRLWAFVRDVAQRVGTQPPRNVVVGLDLNFFATEQQTVCYSGELSGRTVFVSLPFSRIMSVDELRAVLAHELGHFRGWDTRFSRVFYPVWRGALVSLARLGEEMGESVFSSLPLLPAYGVLSFFIGSFEEAEARLNRSRELAADRVSVEVTDPRTTATALVKTHGFGRYWRRAQALMREQVARAEQDLNISALFAVAAEENRGSAWMRKDLNEVAPPHPTDTHPPLGTRLERLGLSIADVEEGAFTVQPEEPAAALLEKGEGLERALTELEKRRMIEAHEVSEGSKKF